MNPVLQSCIERCVSQSSDMLDKMIERSVTVLQTQAVLQTHPALRLDYDEAARLLSAGKNTWSARYSQALQAQLSPTSSATQSSANSSMPVSPENAPSLSFDQLELMDDAQVENRIETARLQQMITTVCERELAQLDRLISTAMGYNAVDAQSNPLKPQIFIQTLQSVVGESNGRMELRRLWMQQLGAALGTELKALYALLVRELENRGVQAAGYRVLQTPAPQVRSGSNLQDNRAAANEPGLEVTVEQLRQFLHAQVPHQNLPQHPPETAQAKELSEINALMRELGETEELAHLLQSDSETSNASRLETAENAQIANQIVLMLVSNIEAHPQLLESIRQWVHELLQPLQRLAVQDAGFLRSKDHPARQLLDQVMQRSLGFGHEAAHGFEAFFAPVQRYSEMLKDHEDISAQTFLDALHMMQHSWQQLDDEQRQAKEQAVQALLQVEQRQQLAEKIAVELTRRDDCREAPIFIKQFLAHAWSQVLAQARLHATQEVDASRYFDVVTDLLWSVNPEQTLLHKARLMRLIPNLLMRLKEGLKSVNYPSAQHDSFLLELMKVHEAALKAKPKVAPAPIHLPAVAAEKKATLNQELDNDGGKTFWIAPKEAQDSGFLDSSLDSTMFPSAFGASTSSVSSGASSFGAPDIPAIGAWVELQHAGVWVRARLSWASPQGSLFMFTSTNGAPYSMTRRLLDQMLETGGMRIIAKGNLVTGAFNKIAEQALQNTAAQKKR